jgi:hypothetical protein
MVLTQSQRTLIAKARSAGSGSQAITLDDEICTALVAMIAADLELLDQLSIDVQHLTKYFEIDPVQVRLPGYNFTNLVEQLIDMNPNKDAYFSCLSTLHKSRLKYRRIMQAQPLPTIDQVGPRGLLQFGTWTPQNLAGFLFWRKWLFDVDNRAGQETGYLFEPIIAHAIGGFPVGAKRSPVKRGGAGPGRQVDCIRDQHAYEIKLRVTIAASGQGRWREELEFPLDARASGYTPVLVVLDPTPNPKLAELRQKFLQQDGEVYIGPDAWEHLEREAGETLGMFLEKYVRFPLQELLSAAPTTLPLFTAQMVDGNMRFSVGDEIIEIERIGDDPALVGDSPDLPDDVDETLPGV